MRLHIIVSGKVQGVFFRANAKEKADSLGVVGTVENQPDGTVELIAEGEREKLEDLLEWCYHGPDAAKVTDLEFRWAEPGGQFSSFEIKR